MSRTQWGGSCVCGNRRQPPAKGRPSLAFLLLFVVGLGLLSFGWRQPGAASPQGGCDTVYAATSRGGGAPPAATGLACSFRPPPGNDGEWARVTRVVDGDTIVLDTGEHVRYIGLDTPEISGGVEPYGREARDANKRLVDGQRVRLEKDVSETDRYDRLLRYVYVGDILVNAELVREGFAEAVRYPPDTRYAPCFDSLEAEARRAGRGMWSASGR